MLGYFGCGFKNNLLVWPSAVPGADGGAFGRPVFRRESFNVGSLKFTGSFKSLAESLFFVAGYSLPYLFHKVGRFSRSGMVLRKRNREFYILHSSTVIFI